MAQNIILKRSGLAGKVPDTGSLNLGEVAINTYDGKVFFKKSGSVESIQEILTTNSTITGSLSMNGTGSFASLQVNDTLTVNHGSTIISGSQLVTDELTVLGAINARQFNISVVSSSVIYQSGSTKFGDTLDDTHDFTGSVNITGSLLLNGSEVGGTNLPNTFDFNLEQTAAYDFNSETEVEGLVNFVTGDNGDVKIVAGASTADVIIDDVSYLSVSTSSVVVAKSILPDVSGTIDLGSVDKPFRHLYVGTGSIYLVNPQGTISKQISANTIVTTTDIASGSINLTPTLPSGIISGSSQVDVLSTTNISRLATTGSNVFIGAQSVNAGSTSVFSFSVQATSTFDFVGNAKRLAIFSLSGGDGTGIQLGYDAVANTGIIAGSTNSIGAGIDFYTYNGTAWANRMRVASSGIVSINGTNNQTRFILQNTDSAAYLSFTEQEMRMWRTDGSGSDLTLATQVISGAFGAGAGSITFRPAKTERMRISTNGNIGAPNGSNIYNASDARLKQNILPIGSGLSSILALNPVKFNWLDGFEPSEDGKDMLGFVAQEVQEVIPEAVEAFGGDINLNGTTIDNPLRVNEKFLIPVLTKAIQEQQAIIDGLIARIEALENS